MLKLLKTKLLITRADQLNTSVLKSSKKLFKTKICLILHKKVYATSFETNLRRFRGIQTKYQTKIEVIRQSNQQFTTKN